MLGPHGHDWTSIAQPFIATRMMELGGDLSFNLLAMCRSPLLGLRRALAANVREMAALHHAMSRQDPDAWKAALAAGGHSPDSDGCLSAADEAGLAAYGLTPADTTTTTADRDPADPNNAQQPSAEEQPTAALATTTQDGAAARLADLALRQRQLRSEYRGELAAQAEDEERVRGRRQDWTPAIHAWVRRLAEHGVLQELAEEVQ